MTWFSVAASRNKPIPEELLNLVGALVVPVDITSVALRLGMGVYQIVSEYPGSLTVINRKPKIYYNKGMDLKTLRFVLAHQIAHAILHSNERELFLCSYESNSQSQIEQEADRYARELLIPDVLLDQYDLNSISNAEIADIFQVTIHVLMERFNDLNINQDQDDRK